MTDYMLPVRNVNAIIQTTIAINNAGLQFRDSAGNLGSAITYLSSSNLLAINHAGANR